ncbi:MAG: ABC transporter permease, partial [Bryobacteraceae bacterium]
MFSLVRHSLRSWKNAKGLALLAVVALGVGIGCTTAIFTVVDTVLLKPLPYSHGDRWIALFGGSTVGTERDQISSISIGDLQAYQQRTRSFDVFGWYSIGGDFNLTSPGQPQHIDGVEATPSLIDNVGVQPIRGRLFKDSDGLNVALLSNRLWKRLGADPEMVGRTVTLDGQPYTVVGVMPPWFRLPIVSVSNEDVRNDVWIPVKPARDEQRRRYYEIYAAYARLKPGVAVDQARADAKRVASELAKEDPGFHQSYTATVFSLRESAVRDIRPILLLLFGAAGLLLLITCANVAGLLVARAVGRARETAIRVALGGGRGQLALQFFVEGLLVSIFAAGLGLAASVALVRLVVSLATEYIPRADEVSLDWTVMLFALGVGCLAATLSALAPLWQALRTQPNEVLSEGVRASAGARSRGLSKWLVIAEIALAFTLVSAGALLVSHLENLNRTSPGFDPDHLLTFQLNRSEAGRRGEQRVAAQQALLQAFEAIPGINSVAVANQLPLAGCCFQTSIFPEGQPVNPVRSVSLMIVSAGYFKTMRIPLIKGRLLNEHDINENIVPVVIDEDAARRYWRNPAPIGALAHAGLPNGSRLQVVGVAGNVRNEGLGEVSRPEVYVLNALSPPNPMYFIVRSNLPASSLVPAVRRALRTIDPSQPIYAVRTMREVIGGSLTFQRLESIVTTFFAFAALLMAALGVYGLTSYSVRQRTVEMGTRMALGAVGRDLLRLIVGSGFRMAVYGIAIGAAAVAVVTLIIVRFLNVHDISPVPYLYSIVIIVGLAMFASFFPAWRATLLSPMVAIRNESDSIWTTTRRGVEQVLSLVSGAESGDVFDSSLLTEFMEASRRADSYSEVLRLALGTVRDKIQAGSVLLLEQMPAKDYSADGFTIPKDGFLLNRLRFYSSPLAFTPDDLDTSLRWASEQKPEHLGEIEKLKQNDIRLAVALRAKNEIVGVLLLGAPAARNEYSSA